MVRMRSRSVSSNLDDGIPVQTATTLAISSAVTSSLSIRPLPKSEAPSRSEAASMSASSFSKAGNVSYLSSAARFRSYSRSHFSISSVTSATFSLMSVTRSTPPRSACHLALSMSDRFFSSASSPSILNRRLSESRSSGDPGGAFSKSDRSERRSISSWITRRSISSSTSGFELSSFLSLAHASSTRSMALSGRKRSAMYR
mmetsp:Transcript_3214/g.5505  ORF Transcript_3214/g.5505 Transcript_3214/m.5505 type:complete len:201 (-) Transcript_3214:317-919(-)